MGDQSVMLYQQDDLGGGGGGLDGSLTPLTPQDQLSRFIDQL